MVTAFGTTYNTIIVGTGAAGYNAADCLLRLGQNHIAMITEDRYAGTSRNAGSDKQTYYKLTLAGGEGDSVRSMAQTLFDGGSMDGDIALCEAALSSRCFFKLVELGVQFPQNRYGEFVGYKTDHDPRVRATSSGPYTSKMMTEKLEQEVLSKGLEVYDHLLVVRILVDHGQVFGLLCLDLGKQEPSTPNLVLFRCQNIIYATGGPAGMYANSVYPLGHHGSSGIAFEAGIPGRNLTEWQFGIASVNPRWNMSGSYMQVLPRFYSLSQDSDQPSEFLEAHFTDDSKLLSTVFLKGYQWPFDVRKIQGGSSIIDILVYQEIAKGRRVYLDYTRNPGLVDSLDYTGLTPEASSYLKQAEVCFGTPVQRLKKINLPAYDYFLDRGVDLEKEPVEIALSAQHNNGGLAVDCWWQTCIQGFFAVGEVAGTHGVYRPGGSALNSGQVGSLRAAEFISRKRMETPPYPVDYPIEVAHQIGEIVSGIGSVIHSGKIAIQEAVNHTQQQMSLSASIFRDKDALVLLKEKLGQLITHLYQKVSIESLAELPEFFRAKDILISQYVYVQAFLDYIENQGKSRGSALYPIQAVHEGANVLPDQLAFSPEEEINRKIQEIELKPDGSCQCTWREVKSIPEPSVFFEQVWSEFRASGNVF